MTIIDGMHRNSPLGDGGFHSLLNENSCVAAFLDGSQEAKRAITNTVALTSKKSVSRSFTGK